MSFFFWQILLLFFIWSCTVFNYIPILLFTLADWGGGSIMSPLTQRNLHFPADFQYVLSVMAYTSSHFLFAEKMGYDKRTEKIPALFIIYFHTMYSLLIIYSTGSYVFLNKQEITQIPHLSLQPWPRPGALDNECN